MELGIGISTGGAGPVNAMRRKLTPSAPLRNSAAWVTRRVSSSRFISVWAMAATSTVPASSRCSALSRRSNSNFCPNSSGPRRRSASSRSGSKSTRITMDATRELKTIRAGLSPTQTTSSV